ncbi:MAG: phosphoribosylaminoimidazolecarboxamide formyltransferase, 5-formaminoimidazole-4-carboxamide-1-(beta)-D-ribofuranosyl 5'-monophosphate synthetase [Candidatus Peregrinibacteria bacterium GW2011_GWF2_39_17]|nr:MAG: phosphoribosylaminoimidazolecarboxamide formyltransferase, 5-formaminoimidazole-4-carboxamide-1-(beta)-D-ribofuranosyl 5'-monophosphate synthetase [Candidatus Peregrinibacteria bacterium GW2011_GWF2_39_17]HCW32609.1 5-formaminoimidazole-4-carboxamide-1-(beta)-D-ribofuranosyl 5'-monophosphate synthetase [Candidatus Peregrinibacteria bacterium]
MPSTNTNDYRIATIGSHTALQILKGAQEEGLKSLCVVTPNARKIYEYYGVANEFIEVDDYRNFLQIEDELIRRNAIVIPHGSFVSYLGHEQMKKLNVMHYGTKGILEWESDRNKERIWLEKSGLKLPAIFKNPEAINRPVIIKFHGAGGGFGYFIAKSPEEFYERIKKYPKEENYVIQEYIVGVPIYVHYFYSRLKNELEIMSFDKRYESNADSIGRIAARDQLAADIQTSYTIAGNIPMVVRESLLPSLYELGENVVRTSKELVGDGLFGPFCLEGIMDTNLNFFVFEISARIVAGTNPYINGSPYTWLRYNEPMSTGRRLAREIKEAIQSGAMDKILG